MGVYTGRTAKYTRSARFTPDELAAIRELKAKYRQPAPAPEPAQPPSLYRVKDKVWLANGAWKVKKIAGGYMTLEELNAMGRAIRKGKKRQPRIIEMTEGDFMAHVKRDKDFLARVDAAADLHWSDVLAAKGALPFELKVALAHKLHWAACHPKEQKKGLAKRAHELINKSATYSNGDMVDIRHGRTGTILRILTDGRCVVRINEMSFLAWEIYRQAELAALNVAAAEAA